MGTINAEHINVFLMALTKILHDMCGYQAKVGKPAIRKCEFQDNVLVIMIGITGEMRGQVMLAFDDSAACDVAGKMMMMPVEQLDEIATSAICELTNMIMGNAATLFSVKGIGVDITPPTVCKGNMSFEGVVSNFSVPIYCDGTDKKIELNLTIES